MTHVLIGFGMIALLVVDLAAIVYMAAREDSRR